jgi:transposase
MKRFVECEDRTQLTFLPGCLDDYVSEDNLVRVVEALVDDRCEKWASRALGQHRRAARHYHPSRLLKISTPFLKPRRSTEATRSSN